MKAVLTHSSRRRFLQTTASLAAASTLPRWFLEEAAAAAESPVPRSANDQPAIALIGCGGRGRSDGHEASRYGRMVALCDVDAGRLAEAGKTWPKADTYQDFRKVIERKDVDCIICGTVDHWHVLVSMAAMRAGKDIYCEKPLTLTIDEGKHLVRTAKQTGRILQTGSQQRSDKNFRLACELALNGRLGEIKQIDVVLPEGPRSGPFSPSEVPAGFEYDTWLGSTPVVPYVKQRTHGSFRYWWDYSGGTMTDWGAHHNDIALWGLGLERSGPVAVDGRSLVQMIPDGYTAASQYEVEYTYANGVTHTCRSTPASAWNGAGTKQQGAPHGVRFTGSDGWVWVTRGRIEASNPELLETPLPANARRLYVSTSHMGNFFDCVRSRKAPICEAEIGHRSVSVCHLGVISMRLGRALKWDPDREEFVGDKEANGWLAREMRKPWNYDNV